MRESMAKEKLSADKRREIVLAALAGAEKKALAAEHGISRQWVYDLLEDAKDDPEGKFQEAVAEAAFRREVRDLLAEKDGPDG